MRPHAILEIAGYVGAILLRSGAGPDRATEAMTHLGRSLGAPCLRSRIGAADLLVTVQRRRGRPLAGRWSIVGRDRSLSAVCAVTALTHTIVAEPTPYRSTMARLAAIDRAAGPYPTWLRSVATIAAATAIAMLGVDDSNSLLPAIVTAAMTQTALVAGRRTLAVHVVAGAIAALTPLVLLALGWNLRLDVSISAGVIPYVPGLILADVFASLLGGAPRLTVGWLLEGFVKAGGLAVGVGVVLAAWFALGGPP